MAYEPSKNVVVSQTAEQKKQEIIQRVLQNLNTLASNTTSHGIDMLDAVNRWIPISENDHFFFTDGKIYGPIIWSKNPVDKKKIMEAMIKKFKLQ